MVRLGTLLIVIATLVIQEPQASPSASSTPNTKKFKPIVRLSCDPRIVISAPGVPARIWASFQIVHPDEKLWCSEIAWYVRGDFQGSEQSDCQPYAQALASQEGDVEYWSVDASRQFSVWPGKYQIKVKLRKSGKVIAETECVGYVQ